VKILSANATVPAVAAGARGSAGVALLDFAVGVPDRGEGVGCGDGEFECSFGEQADEPASTSAPLSLLQPSALTP
jgi:hypothetical protein